MSHRIDPKGLIRELSVEELCQTAEEYYRRIPDPSLQMAKPFAGLDSAPDLLVKMGLILAGLRLGKSMIILEFGAGTCWFSRFLNQLQCSTIAVDASPTALEIGRRLFDESPIVGRYLRPPQFLPFNGHIIDVATESVDRIICFDTFHHVPNQQQVLSEFYRVLKPGAIAGFSEPGFRHSQSPQSRYEMRNYRVLENDVILSEIGEIARAVGSTGLYLKLATSPELDLSIDDYQRIAHKRKIPRKVSSWLVSSMQNSTTFFLTKDQPVPDSRSYLGLSHRLTTGHKHLMAAAGQPLEVRLRLRNTGSARWLHANVGDIGVVMVGTHLYQADHRLLDLDFHRHRLEGDVLPGQELDLTISPVFGQPGDYILAIDLVSEHVCWFENIGSRPETITVHCE